MAPDARAAVGADTSLGPCSCPDPLAIRDYLASVSTPWLPIGGQTIAARLPPPRTLRPAAPEPVAGAAPTPPLRYFLRSLLEAEAQRKAHNSQSKG